VITDFDGPDKLCAGPRVNVPSEPRHATMCSANCDLLEKQAIGSDLRVRMDDNPVWVRNQEASAQVTRQRYVRTAHCGPKSMA
jgi:hypothetical protein